MNKKLLSILVATTALSAASTANAFDNGDIINFKPGEYVCVYGGVYPACTYDVVGVTGSYFAMDTDASGSFRDNEKVPISPGSDGGIVIGALQAASASHMNCPDGTEVAPVDAPWCFFGNTGMHQVIGTPVTDNGDGTLDFSGWGVTWNGIQNIPMGTVVSNAVLTCSSSPCTVNDTYEINHTSAVPQEDPSNFGGVRYTVHLESNGPFIPTASIVINVDGGETQECTTEGGSTIQMSATTNVPADDSVASINWIVDGVNVATGADVSAFIALGAHHITASVLTVNGLTGIEDATVTVRDTTNPVATAAFLDKKTGAVISTAINSEKVLIQAEASDICDPAPVVAATVGAPVMNGQKIKIDSESGKVKLHASNLGLTVTATDSSGNSSTAMTTLTITQ